MMPTAGTPSVDMKRALDDPADVFGVPEAVVAHAGLSDEDKIRILRRWEYDASEAEVAGEEGMPGGDHDLLHRILLALDQLTGGGQPERVAPTKQHGLVDPPLSGRVVREAVGVFYTSDAFQDAIDDLLSSGFDRSEVSLLASATAVERMLGHAYEKVADVEDDTAVPRCCYVSRESVGDAKGALIGGLLYVGAVAASGAIVASGGTLAVILAGAALAGGAGAAVGAVLAELLDERYAKRIQEQLDHGGLVLWVLVRDIEHERRAVSILEKHSGHDVHVHPVAVP